MAIPEVSIVVPCRNEEATIGKLLEAIARQTVPLSSLEVIVVDGMSTDGTKHAIREFSERHAEISLRLVENPAKTIPAALNVGIGQAKGEVVVRLDAHSVPQEDYLENCLSVLRQSGAANAGGLWVIKPSDESWIARSIAVAASHPLGAGDARYRIGGQAGEVETIPFGAYPKEWLDRVGPFNESLLTNEDYEYNLRLRQAGGMIWFDPRIRSDYFSRPNLGSLLRQYGRYGYWKARMLRLHPQSIRWRQTVAPLFVITALILLLAGLIQPMAWILLSGVLLIYLAFMLMAGVAAGILKRDARLAIGVPAALVAMHLSWGGAFLWGLIRPKVSRNRLYGKG